MRVEKTLKFERPEGEAPVCVTVKELTVAEMRAWLADASRLDTTPFDLLLLEAVSDGEMVPADLLRFTDLTDYASLDGYSPSQLRQVVAAVKEVNGAFFVIQARLGLLAPMLSGTWSEPPAASPESATAPVFGITPTASS